jgi:sulfonate dioxygenase
MAPSRTDEPQDSEHAEPKTTYDINVPFGKEKKNSDAYELRIRERTEFPEYLPVWEEGIWHPDFPEFEFHDPALRAEKKMPHIFIPGVTAKAVTPRMGTILTGLKLETLCQEGKDELALLICERKFVVLREQSDFLHAGPQFQVDFMSYFGKLSNQPITGAIKGFPQFHVIHRDSNEEEIANFFKHKMSTCIWHHDVSYERQPPGYIMLGILACPDVGGDTIVADTVEAYKRLSPAFQGMINKVKAVHTSEKLIGYARAIKGTVRSNPIDSIHPVVRVHPVTGERAIFINKEFPREIIGLKDQEAEVIMKFLMDHMAMGHDFQARVHWEKHSVVMFDGRQTIRKLHTDELDSEYY